MHRSRPNCPPSARLSPSGPPLLPRGGFGWGRGPRPCHRHDRLSRHHPRATHDRQRSHRPGPFLLGSNTAGQLVAGLNADQLDGRHAGNASGNIPLNNGALNAGLSADKLDGQEGSYYLDYNNLTNKPAAGFTLDTCKAYLSGTFNATSSADSPIALNAEYWDYNTLHDNATNNTRITIKTAGVYTITGRFAMATAPSQWATILKVRKNGATEIGRWYMGADIDGTVTLEYLFAVNDYIELIAWINNGGAAKALNLAELSVTRVA